MAFVLGFVLLGVGSGSTGISDVLGNMFSGGSGGGTSISSLQKKVDKNPGSAKDWRDLATALEQKQRTQEAVNALERYTALRPKDQNALGELASQYGTLATNYATDYSNAQAQASQYAAPGAVFAPASTTPFGKAFADPTALQDPISTAVQTLASTTQSTAYTNFQNAQKSAERCNDPDPARPGRTGRQRLEDRDRRLRSLPQTGAHRPARAAGEVGLEDTQADGACCHPDAERSLDSRGSRACQLHGGRESHELRHQDRAAF